VEEEEMGGEEDTYDHFEEDEDKDICCFCY